MRCSNTRHRVTLPTEATVQDLLLRVRDLTGLSPSRQVLKIGYPPQPVSFGRDGDRRLVDAGVHPKDLIIVEERKAGTLSDSREGAPSLANGCGTGGALERVDGASGDRDLAKRRKEGDARSEERLHVPGVVASSTDTRTASHDANRFAGRLEGSATSACPARQTALSSPAGCTPQPSALGSASHPPTLSSSLPPGSTRLTDGPDAARAMPLAPHSAACENSREAQGQLRRSLQAQVAHPGNVGDVFRFVVPSDNSCLFTCLSLLAAPDKRPQDLRQLVASAIANDPESFSSAILGRPREEYIHWITTPTSWGGYVELAILAQQLRHEVLVVDIETRRKDLYGDRNTGRRIMLLYDGVHYDAVLARPRGVFLAGRGETEQSRGGAFFPVGPRGQELFCYSVFSPNDTETEAKAMELASELHKKRNYVNLREMSLHCLVCGVGIRDQDAMRAHAKETGHANFGENRR